MHKIMRMIGKKVGKLVPKIGTRFKFPTTLQ